RPTVTVLVERIHRIARRVQRRGHMRVPAAVLGVAVQDDHDSDGLPVRQPGLPVDASACGAGEPAFSVLAHAPVLPDATHRSPAPHDPGGAAAPALRLGRREQLAAGQELDTGGGTDLPAVDELVPTLLQRLGLRAVDPGLFGAGGLAV